MSHVAADPRPEEPKEGGTQLGKAIALILVAAALAVVVLLHERPPATASVRAGHPTTTTTTSPPTTARHRPPPAPLAAPSTIKVQVLNGLQAGTLATHLSATLKTTYGYQTLTPLNTTAATSTSAIYVLAHHFYRNGVALARKLGQSPAIVHRGMPANAPVPSTVRHQAALVVVIGTSLKAKAGG